MAPGLGLEARVSLTTPAHRGSGHGAAVGSTRRGSGGGSSSAFFTGTACQVKEAHTPGNTDCALRSHVTVGRHFWPSKELEFSYARN